MNNRIILLLGWLCAVASLSSAAATTAGAPDFTREVRPLLSRHCFKCHGPDDATRKGNLRLDVRESALHPAKSGAIALVPGKVDDSELVKRIFTKDEDEVMPPPSTKVVLTATEKDILKRWVAAGGEYKQHWAFAPPVATTPPSVKKKSWVQNPIDQFVLARLEKEKLAPSAPADRYTLVRRVYLDLIGLPPTPDEADAFVNDRSRDAFEKVVDRLLASPQYGERWARRWMDLARYADSNGYEKDRQRTIWPWRDWVIKALNADMPFDQFTIEQIAGDMLPNATVDQIVATGFHRNTMLNEEGGIDPLEFRFHAMTDRVATTGSTWLGLTVGCAQCHTHKYDPITHREYFQMMAFMNNADEPDLDLPKPGWEKEHRANLEKASKLLAQLADKFPIETEQWSTPQPTSAQAASGETSKLQDDGSALFAGASPDKDSYTFVFDTDLTNVHSLRLEALTDKALSNKGPGRTKHGNFVLTEITITASPRNTPNQITPVKISSAKADVEQKEFPVGNAFDGKSQTGWAVQEEDKKLNANHTATFQFDTAVGFAGGTRFVVKLDQNYGGQHLIGRPRISFGAPASDHRPLEIRRRELVDTRFNEWLTRERKRAVRWTALKPAEAKSNLPLLTVQPDNSIFASGDISKNDTYELKFRPELRGITAIRLEAMPDDRLPHHGPGMTYYEGPKGDFFMGEFQLFAGGRQLKIARASESYAKNTYGGSASAKLATDGDPQTGWSTAGREGERHEAVFVLEEPLADAGELQLKMMFGRHYACSLGRFRISVTTQAGGAEANSLNDDLAQLLHIADTQLTAVQRQTLREQFLLNAPELASARKEIEQLRKPPTHPITLVMRERPPENPRPTFIHKRGEFLQPTERVEAGVLSAIAPFPDSLPRNRVGFARWLVARENPLTARVTVNRQWQAFFGRGLVRTTEDFGFQGEAPSHPELLDWLAVDFMKQGWSLKKLHKQIVMSATYQQSSRATPQMLAKDSENRLLARGPSIRLEAEIIRDAALRASGLLSAKMGGPSVYPPQPAGVTEVAYGGSSWPTSTGEDRHRRSLYTFMKRTAPFAMFNTFDAPTGESCVARRDVSNTPLQALTLLNDVFFVEVSQAMGKLLAAREGSVEDRVRYAFRRCLTRPPTKDEVAMLVKFFEAQKQRIASAELDAKQIAGDGEGDVAQRAAWATLARAIMNLDEMITKG
ncbi:MAG: PSD1 domain-containing protein [Verrucomicrobia bacterium]|nr:PSD1 domain-containing protein [Verrucomicrobiota bacterium]